MDAAIRIHETEIRAYDKTWSFPAKGDRNHYTERNRVIAEAQEYGKRLLATMEQQAGRRLTVREQITGRLVEPPQPKPIEHLTQQVDPDKNPFAQRLGELSRQRPMLPSDRAQRDRRLEKVKELHDQWQARHEVEKLVEAHSQDEKVQVAREHSEHSLNHAKLDPRALPSEIATRQRLFDEIHRPLSEPRDYWQASDQADREWFQRLDQLAAEKRQAVEIAQANLAAARAEAKAARKYDEQPAEQVAVEPTEQTETPAQ